MAVVTVDIKLPCLLHTILNNIPKCQQENTIKRNDKWIACSSVCQAVSLSSNFYLFATSFIASVVFATMNRKHLDNCFIFISIIAWQLIIGCYYRLGSVCSQHDTNCRNLNNSHQKWANQMLWTVTAFKVVWKRSHVLFKSQPIDSNRPNDQQLYFFRNAVSLIDDQRFIEQQQ